MKLLLFAVFIATGLAGSAMSLYLMGGYLGGFPTTWWSGPLVITLLGASLAMVAAGVVVWFSPRTSRALTFCGGGVIGLFLLMGFVDTLSLLIFPRASENIAWGPSLALIVFPFILTTLSIGLAVRLR